MSDITWPAILPCFLLDGYGYKRKSIVVRTEMETGRMRVRQRFADGPTVIHASMQVNRAQFAYFEGWWLNVIGGGSSEFDAPIAIGQGDSIPHECKFIDEYEVSALGGGKYRIDVQLLATRIDVFDADTLDAIDAYAGDIAEYADFLDALHEFVNTFLPTVL